MTLSVISGAVACLSLALLFWQWLVARRFPLHQRIGPSAFAPAVTLLKSLKGCDGETEVCLRSWFAQEYAGDIQLLFGVASADDPVAGLIEKLTREFPGRDARLVVISRLIGANAKVSKLAELEPLARHEILVISDADVRVPPDFLANVVAPLREPEVGLVSSFYRLANPTTTAMRWEAIAINADFWSQALQSESMKPLDFALGAVMVVRRQQLAEIGGFPSLADCLADDYQLGNRIARRGHRLALCPIVVECWDPPMNWSAVWKHQLRWARTIRVCQPVPYFFSILANTTLWAVLWFLAALVGTAGESARLISQGGGLIFTAAVPVPFGILAAVAGMVLIRILAAYDLERRLTRSSKHAKYFWLVPIKDLLQFLLWFGAFTGQKIEWRGHRYQLRRDGTLVPIG